MRAMQIKQLGAMQPSHSPLEFAEVPVPEPGVGQVRIKVSHCGVCHTELDEIEGRTPPRSITSYSWPSGRWYNRQAWCCGSESEYRRSSWCRLDLFKLWPLSLLCTRG